MTMVFAEDLNFLFSKQEKLCITIVLSGHWINLREVITDQNGYTFSHTLTLFNDGTQLSVVMPVIILVYTASLSYQRRQSTMSQIMVLTNIQQ
jgi:hypothetical protein